MGRSRHGGPGGAPATEHSGAGPRLCLFLLWLQGRGFRPVSGPSEPPPVPGTSNLPETTACLPAAGSPANSHEQEGQALPGRGNLGVGPAQPPQGCGQFPRWVRAQGPLAAMLRPARRGAAGERRAPRWEPRLSGPERAALPGTEGGPVRGPAGPREGSGPGPWPQGLARGTDTGEKARVRYLQRPELGGRHFLLELEWQ